MYAQRRRLALLMEGKNPDAMAEMYRDCPGCGRKPKPAGEAPCGTCQGSLVVKLDEPGEDELAALQQATGEFCEIYGFLERHGMAGMVAVYGLPGEGFLEAVRVFDAEMGRLEVEARRKQALGTRH